MTSKFCKLWKIVSYYIFPGLAYTKWKKRTKEESANGYSVNLESPSNEFLYETLNNLNFQSLLEIGSNCGNRILKFAEENPTKNFVGIDLNKSAVKLGNQIALDRGLNNILFLPIDVRRLHKDLNENFDIILTWATLVVLPPRHHKRVIREMVARAKILILIERGYDYEHSFFQKLKLQLKGFPNWIYDYCKISNCYGLDYEERAVPQNIWNPGGGLARMMILSKSEETLCQM